MDLSKLSRSEWIAVAGGLLLLVGIFLPWYVPNSENRNAIVAGSREAVSAWEAHSLSVLTEGRFEMGIGAGRPGIEDELRESGLPAATPGQRLSMVHDAVAAVRRGSRLLLHRHGRERR